jgi:hypothetical protein
MWRAANRSVGQNGWAYGLAATRNSPTGVEFTVAAGSLALDGVWFYSTSDITVTGSASAGTHAIIAKFGNDRTIEIAHVIDYDVSPPEYDHVLLYLDVQSTSYTLIDKRADTLIMPLLNRENVVSNTNIAAGSVTRDKLSNNVIQAGFAVLEYYNTYLVSKNVVFSTPFDETPVVILTNNSTTDYSFLGLESAYVYNVSKYGFTIFAETHNNFVVKRNWIATAQTQ